MKIQSKYALAMVLFSTLLFGCASLTKNTAPAPAASDSGLVSSLTQKLGVSNEQATGGAGAILGYAKGKLSPEDYSSVNKAIPESDTLIKSAPKEDNMTSKLGNMASSLGGGEGKSAGGLGALAGSFGKLGLSPDMASKFLPVVLEYANSKGGSKVSGLLQGVF